MISFGNRARFDIPTSIEEGSLKIQIQFSQLDFDDMVRSNMRWKDQMIFFQIQFKIFSLY